MDNNIGVAINYYTKSANKHINRYAASLAISLLRQSPIVGNIVLVDGSKEKDNRIQDFCDEHGCTYIHKGRELLFAEGYNIGWKILDEDYVALMASDILPMPDTFERLFQYIHNPRVGCVFPYLTSCAYSTQDVAKVRRNRTCEPSALTLNLNLFRKDVLVKIGGVNENYTGSYNDIIILNNIRNEGYKVILVGGTAVVHLGKTTVSYGSNYNIQKDRRRFRDEYREICTERGIFGYKHWREPFSTTTLSSILWWLNQNLPGKRLRHNLERFTCWIEPDITASKVKN